MERRRLHHWHLKIRLGSCNKVFFIQVKAPAVVISSHQRIRTHQDSSRSNSLFYFKPIVVIYRDKFIQTVTVQITPTAASVLTWFFNFSALKTSLCLKAMLQLNQHKKDTTDTGLMIDVLSMDNPHTRNKIIKIQQRDN